MQYWNEELGTLNDELEKAKNVRLENLVKDEAEFEEEMKPLLVAINPEWKPVTEKMNWFYETCGTCPNLRARKARYNTIRASFQSRDGSRRVCFIQGPDARVFQQQCDNLQGNWLYNAENFSSIYFDHEVARRQREAEIKIKELMEFLSEDEQKMITESFDLVCPLTEEDMGQALEQYIKMKSSDESGLNGFSDNTNYKDFQEELDELQKRIDEELRDKKDLDQREMTELLDDIFTDYWTTKLRKDRENMDI